MGAPHRFGLGSLLALLAACTTLPRADDHGSPLPPQPRATLLHESKNVLIDPRPRAVGGVLSDVDTEERLVRGDAVFYVLREPPRGSAHDHEHSNSLVGTLSLSTGSRRVLSNGHLNPMNVVADDEAVYFVEAGLQESMKDEFRRTGCCSIWRAPR